MLMLPQRHPHTSHSKSYLFSDSPGGVKYYLLHSYFWFDINGNCSADGTVWIVHWSTAAKNGFHFYEHPDGKIGPDPRPHVPWNKRHDDDLIRLRTAQHGGRRPYKAFEIIREIHNFDEKHPHHDKNGRRVRRIPMIEAKGSPEFGQVKVWANLKAETDAIGAVFAVMTLQDIKGWPRRLAAAHRAGLATALLPRLRRPTWWLRKRPAYVQQVWGSFRRPREHRKA